MSCELPRARSCELGTGSWQLVAGSYELGAVMTNNWELEAVSCELVGALSCDGRVWKLGAGD